MPFSTSVDSSLQRFHVVLASLLQKPGLPFADALPEEAIQAAFEEEGAAFGQEDDAVYTPAVTLWTFLSQVFFKEEQRSCVAAVSRLIVLLVSLGRKPAEKKRARRPCFASCSIGCVRATWWSPTATSVRIS